jgi:hypothetical protein
LTQYIILSQSDLKMPDWQPSTIQRCNIANRQVTGNQWLNDPSSRW